MWAKITLFAGGAAFGYLLRKQVVEAVEVGYNRPSNMVEPNKAETVSTKSTFADNEAVAEGNTADTAESAAVRQAVGSTGGIPPLPFIPGIMYL